LKFSIALSLAVPIPLFYSSFSLIIPPLSSLYVCFTLLSLSFLPPFWSVTAVGPGTARNLHPPQLILHTHITHTHTHTRTHTHTHTRTHAHTYLTHTHIL